MNLKERAKIFAVNAHRGQVRKSEPDKPMIMHPIGVGNLLEEYEYDDKVVAAGYLHDVVEDTKYTIEDIEREFGKDIANLVMGASEPDKSLSWKERKEHTIKITKTLPMRNKAVVCADKINNLEDLMIKFQKSGVRDFSAFKKGEEDQKWYYTSVYNSLICNEDKELPIFKRLKNVIDIVFYNKENEYLKNTIFKDNMEYYEKLKKLHAQKMELKKLKELCVLDKPFVIEFCGTPRTGKTSIMNALYDFFKKGGFNINIIEEFTNSKYYKEIFKQKYEKMGTVEFNIAIIEEVSKQLKEAIKHKNDIIVIDRSINDRQIWNYRKYSKGIMNTELYNKTTEKYKNISKELINFLVVTYAEPEISLKRDYLSSLSLEDRRFLNVDNLNEYNDCLNSVRELIESSVKNSIWIDTSFIKMNDVSIDCACEIMNEMRKEYIESFKIKYDL